MTCKDDPNFCTSCGIGLYLFENKCITDCGDYYYGDDSLRLCVRCHDTCRNCIGSAIN